MKKCKTKLTTINRTIDCAVYNLLLYYILYSKAVTRVNIKILLIIIRFPVDYDQ